MSEDVEARKLGERLLLDVHVEGLSSILNSLRALTSGNDTSDTTSLSTHFNIPELDALLPTSSPTVLELVSPPHTHHPSGAGKTSILYLIVAHAILPPTFTSIPDLNGHSAAIILLDPLHHFSVPRLANVVLSLLVSKLSAPIDALDPSIKADLLSLTASCLDHVHIFHPSSWDSLIITLRSLPGYLFDGTRHRSSHRRVHSLVIDDVDAFTWSLRAASAAEALNKNASALGSASREFTAEVKKLTGLLSCNAVLTSTSVLPSAFRPSLPTAWPSGMGVTRLAVRRVEVVKFAPEMSVEQAEAERQQRWEVVRRGRFECWKAGAGEGPKEGFVFRIGTHGVEIERASGE